MHKLARLSTLVAVAGLAGFAATGVAPAADMRARAPVYKAPPPVVTAYSWTGCYIGGHFGGLWATKDWSNRVGISVGGHHADSGLGGLQAGCDYQFAGGFVVGIQGDYAWTDAEGSHLFAVDNFTNRSRIKSLASVTGRIGYAWDRFLGYVKGGGAWERDQYESLDNLNGFLFTASETRSGWTVGVGGEYAFTNFLSGFVEYDYYDFGSRDNTFTGLAGTFIVNIKEHKSVVKGGLNFRFGGWSGPVAAKY